MKTWHAMVLAAALLVACEQSTDPVTPNPSPSGHPSLSVAPNEPAGFTVLTDWSFTSTATGSGWGWCFGDGCSEGTSSAAQVVPDPSTPGTAPNVLRWNDTENPAWLGFVGREHSEEHSAFWWKGGSGPTGLVSRSAYEQGIDLLIDTSHTGSPILAVGLINLGDRNALVNENSSCQYDAVHSFQTCRLYGNVNGGNRVVAPDTWHRIEWYLKSGGPATGRIRWWLDGTLVGDYNVAFPSRYTARYDAGRAGRFDDIRISVPPVRAPDQTLDLHSTGATSARITLRFAIPDDGTGRAARFDIRYAQTPIGWGWGSATSVNSAQCRGEFDPNQPVWVGNPGTCIVEGLEPGTSYDFQMVNFRTENGRKVFGPLSNVTTQQTSGSPSGTPGGVHIVGQASWSNAMYLSFVETDDGTGNPAHYEFRVAEHPIQWGSATPVTSTSAAGSPVVSCKEFAGRAPGTKTVCYVVGLSPGRHYDIQAVAYRGFLNQGAVFGPLSNVISFETRTDNGGAIGTIWDLAAQSPQGPDPQHQILLAFTPAHDGLDQPLRYDIRYRAGSMQWWSAESVSQGTCTDASSYPVGSTNPHQVYCWVHGLQPGTNYEFQLVPYRGTLNQDADFGPLSNVTTGHTTN